MHLREGSGTHTGNENNIFYFLFQSGRILSYSWLYTGNPHQVEGSITVLLTACLNGLNSTKQINLLILINRR